MVEVRPLAIKEATVKRAVILLILLALPAIIVCCIGCGGTGQDDKNGEVTVADFDVGRVEGYAEGYDRGYADGRNDSYSPEPDLDEEWNEDYSAGYGEGWLDGYEDGYGDAVAETSSDEEGVAEVEEAMLTFVKENSVPGMEFKIENIVINGNDAAGRAVCTSENLESPYVIMKRGSGGWYGVEFGTGIEPPTWYPY
jgi:hypothetical protein